MTLLHHVSLGLGLVVAVPALSVAAVATHASVRAVTRLVTLAIDSGVPLHTEIRVGRCAWIFDVDLAARRRCLDE